MALSYKGIWGYAPLIVSLANTREVLYLVNRPGNVVSHEGCVPWIERAIAQVRPFAGRITLRGDTDFTLTGELDRWDGEEVKFIFGMDAHPKVVALAQALGPEAWTPLERLPRYEIATAPRGQRERIKEKIVRRKGYENKVLVGESIAQFDYQPLKCARPYRRDRGAQKHQRAERRRRPLRRHPLLLLPHQPPRGGLHCATDCGPSQPRKLSGQENVIEQLKNGVNAMRMPVDDLMSNWAYMVMTSLGWNLKAWYGLVHCHRERGWELVRMEFRRFLHAIVLLPAQIVRSGRRIIYRLLSYNSWAKDFFAAWEELRRMAPA